MEVEGEEGNDNRAMDGVKQENSAEFSEALDDTVVISMRDGKDTFEVVRLIGRGDVGRVYLVKHVQTGKPYAMKVMNKKDIIQRKKVRK